MLYEQCLWTGKRHGVASAYRYYAVVLRSFELERASCDVEVCCDCGAVVMDVSVSYREGSTVTSLALVRRLLLLLLLLFIYFTSHGKRAVLPNIMKAMTVRNEEKINENKNTKTEVAMRGGRVKTSRKMDLKFTSRVIVA